MGTFYPQSYSRPGGRRRLFKACGPAYPMGRRRLAVAFLFVLALALGLAPAGLGGDVEAGPVSLGIDEGVDLAVDGVADAHAGADGVQVDAAIVAPLVPALDVALAPAEKPSSSEGSAQDSPADGWVATMTQPAVAGPSIAAILLAAAAWGLRAFGLAPWLPFFSRIEDGKLAAHPARRAALDFIASNPGATLQDVRRGLGLAWGTTVHHLGRLERAGLVAVRHAGGRRCHFPLGQAPPRDGLAPADRALAALVRDNPGLAQKDLARLAGLQPPAACKRLARLEEAGLVSAQRVGKGRHYLPTAALLTASPAVAPVPMVSVLAAPRPMAIPA